MQADYEEGGKRAHKSVKNEFKMEELLEPPPKE